MKKMKTMKKSMRILVMVLVSLVCFNGVMIAMTMVANAEVTSAATKKFAASMVSPTVKEAVAEKVQIQAALIKKAEEKAAQKVKAASIQGTASSNSDKKTQSTTSTTSTSGSSSTSQTAATTSSGSTTQSGTSSSGSSSTSSLRGSVNSALIDAFDQLEFTIKINENSSYAGYFSTSKHCIELREVSVGTFRHEMGHFLDALKNMPSKSSEFAAIYKDEKSDYSGSNYSYVTSNAQEYFAQSYRNYLEDSSKLKSERPDTYAFIKNQVSTICSSDITRTYNQYSWAW